MQIPRQQAQFVELADHIINGITEHPEIFTICNAAILEAKRVKFQQQAANLIDAESKVAIAAAAKLESYRDLQQEVKNLIKLCTVVTCGNPAELSYIGWGTKRAPRQIEIPASPGNLRITAQGDNGMLCLVWEKGRNNGGPVRSFNVERRQFNGNWSEWQLAGTSYNSDIKLTKQPIGLKLEYQVRAGNSSGQSMPTNTVSVVL